MKKLDRKAIGLFFLQYLVRSVVFVLIFCVVIFFLVYVNMADNSVTFATLVTVLLFLLYLGAIYLWSVLFYNSYQYEMTPDSFKQEFGVLAKEYISVPYDNIQDVEIIQDVFLRLLGLSRIDIKTAGEGEEEEAAAVLVAVAITDAKKLRDELMKKVDEHR